MMKALPRVVQLITLVLFVLHGKLESSIALAALIQFYISMFSCRLSDISDVYVTVVTVIVFNPYPADCNYCAFAMFAPNWHKFF